MSATTAVEQAKLDEARNPNTEEPQWVYRVPAELPRPDTAIVFVHGIFGGTLSTWRNTKAKQYFYDLVSHDPKYRTRFDIFAFGFTSNYLKPGSFSILQAATKLKSQLQHQHIFEYKRVVFVAHSMGGLVVMRMLLDNREQFLQRDQNERVPLIVLFSTPQEGSQITTIAQRLLNNSSLAEMLPGEKSDFIYQLDRDWKNIRSTEIRPHVACAYETLATFGIRIVSWASATRFCSGDPEPVGADHIDIVKPENSDTDSSYIALANALDSYVPPITNATSSAVTTPAISAGSSLKLLPTFPGNTSAPINWNMNRQLFVHYNGGADSLISNLIFFGESTRTVALKEAYITSGMTGRKQELVSNVPNKGYYAVSEVTIPANASVSLCTVNKPPLSIREFLDQWGKFTITVVYDDGSKFEQQFDEDVIQQKLKREIPDAIGPRVTPRLDK